MNTDKHGCGQLETETEFLNVDLILASRKELKPFLEAIGKKAHVLGQWRLRGMYWANLEVNFNAKTAASAILGFVKLVDKLSPQARKSWSSAAVRDFDVGVQSGANRGATLVLGTPLLKEIARVGGRLVFTIYHADRSRAGRLPEI